MEHAGCGSGSRCGAAHCDPGGHTARKARGRHSCTIGSPSGCLGRAACRCISWWLCLQSPLTTQQLPIVICAACLIGGCKQRPRQQMLRLRRWRDRDSSSTAVRCCVGQQEIFRGPLLLHYSCLRQSALDGSTPGWSSLNSRHSPPLHVRCAPTSLLPACRLHLCCSVYIVGAKGRAGTHCGRGPAGVGGQVVDGHIDANSY
jgi:hypothetical protein